MADLTAEQLDALYTQAMAICATHEECLSMEKAFLMAHRCAEAERVAKRLWLRNAVVDRLLTLCDTREFSLCRALRLTKRVPVPVVVDTDMGFGDTGVTIDPAARERLRGFVDELVDLLGAKRPVLSRHAREREEAPSG